jgi:hypothetical protein
MGGFAQSASHIWEIKQKAYLFTVNYNCRRESTTKEETSLHSVLSIIIQSAQAPITVAVRSKAWTVFARSDTGVMGSNPTSGMDVCIHLFCAFVVLCVQVAALWNADPPTKECIDQETEKRPMFNKRAVEPQIERYCVGLDNVVSVNYTKRKNVWSRN